MNKRQERALEVFLYVTFAIALVVGVGTTKSDTNFLPTSIEATMTDAEAVIDFGQALANDISQDEFQLQSTISFARGDDRVNAVGRLELFKHSMILRDNPHLILNIIAHADSREPVSISKTLSEKRAAAVYELLVFYGTPREQLIVDSFDDAVLGRVGVGLEDHRAVELQYVSTHTSRVWR